MVDDGRTCGRRNNVPTSAQRDARRSYGFACGTDAGTVLFAIEEHLYPAFDVACEYTYSSSFL